MKKTIKFCNSQLPSLFKSIKIAIDSEEDDIPTTDISHLFGESDSEDDKLTKNFLEKVASALSEKLGNMLGLTGPGVDQSTERISKVIESLGKANTEKLDEIQQRRFDNAKYYVLHTIGQNAIDSGNLNLFEVCNFLAEPGKNPFSYSDVKLVIQGMLNR
jgi:cytochrome oxidase Cu insertion factor (SCO1/SenC/PrrC family)